MSDNETLHTHSATDSNPLKVVDKVYFDSYPGVGDAPDAPHGRPYFSQIADRISRSIAPASVLDVGCALGLLVEALRTIGIDAHGIDTSEYALEQVSEDLRPFCVLGSILQPLPGQSDLITCMGVLEHLSSAEAPQAIANLCAASDDILISLSPNDHLGEGHFNVQEPEYWAGLFAEYGFFRDLDYDASFMAPWAMRFRRRRDPVHRIVSQYERKLWRSSNQITVLRQRLLQSRSTETPNPPVPDASRTLYLDLMKRCLTRYGFEASSSFDAKRREEGRDWPVDAETMIGLLRLDNIQTCLEDVITKNVPGDVIETGVWRGGAAIFMRAILKAFGDKTRAVWVADSFQGLPEPDATLYPDDVQDGLWTVSELAVSLDEVQANFSRYDLLDNQVRFLPGWFRDTLPYASIECLSVLRLDGDMYESTMDAFRALYPKLSPGGYVIVDDYLDIRGCKQATDDYRAENGITDPIETIDWTGVYWQKTNGSGT